MCLKTLFFWKITVADQTYDGAGKESKLMVQIIEFIKNETN